MQRVGKVNGYLSVGTLAPWEPNDMDTMLQAQRQRVEADAKACGLLR